MERRPSSSRLDRQVDRNLDEDKKALKREMMAWWMGLSDHMDKIVGRLLCNVFLITGDIFYLGGDFHW